VNGEMYLSEIGEIAQQFWHDIPYHFPFVLLDAFVIMPNHVHGIIIINKNDDGRYIGGEDGGDNGCGNGVVETQNFASLQHYNHEQLHPKNKFGSQSKNLASIIRGYKTGVKKYATMNNINFTWQPRYNDRIIRNNQSFNRIQKYINNNVKNWGNDDFNN